MVWFGTILDPPPPQCLVSNAEPALTVAMVIDATRHDTTRIQSHTIWISRRRAATRGAPQLTTVKMRGALSSGERVPPLLVFSTAGTLKILEADAFKTERGGRVVEECRLLSRGCPVMWNNALGGGVNVSRLYTSVRQKKTVNRVSSSDNFSPGSHLSSVAAFLASLFCTRQTLLTPAANRYSLRACLHFPGKFLQCALNQDLFHRKVWFGKMLEYPNGSRNKNDVLFSRRGLRRVARFFGAGKKMPNIKELGLYALLSYGFVSNASYAICVGLAWFASSKKTGIILIL